MMRSPAPVGDDSSGNPADEELIERVRVGDPDAFDTLVRRHLEKAYRIAYRLLGHREDAEDLVQDSFMAVLEKIETFQTGRQFAPWFHRIVVNRGINFRGPRAVRRMEQIPESIAAEGISPLRHAEQSELRTHVGAAIEKLPDRQRMIIELFELEGFSGAEIAQMLDISAGTVRWHLHEARRTLRDTLAPLERKEER
jgi:RNA polymerase sigma-70 factor, ECF subfamily